MANLGELLDGTAQKLLRILPSRRFPKLVADLKALQEKAKKGGPLSALLPGGPPLTPGGTPPPPGSAAATPGVSRGASPVPGSRGPRLALLNSAELDDETAALVWLPLRASLETRMPRVVEIALDALQRLIAAGYLCGEADVLGGRPDDDGTSIGAMDGRGKDARRDGGDPASAPNPSVAKPVAGEIVEAVCWSAEIPDERVELCALKALLTAVTSASFLVHGEALLRAIRACYNLFLGSRNAVNQMTAKATLTQLITMVFRRMEAASPAVPATHIVVAELVLEAPDEAKSLGAPAVLNSVQALMNKVRSYSIRQVGTAA